MADLPTGTVTFLFTDVEGSIKLWEQDATAMQAALARHDEILKQAIEEWGGCVLKTTGDALCPAFPTASNALEAILEAQRALSGEGWKETLRFKVRMALHSGEAEDKWGIAASFFSLANVLVVQDEQPPVERALREPYLAARSRLEEAAWKAAWDEGRAMTFEEAFSYALEGEADSDTTNSNTAEDVASERLS
jgi:hypothetical protein